MSGLSETLMRLARNFALSASLSFFVGFFRAKLELTAKREWCAKPIFNFFFKSFLHVFASIFFQNTCNFFILNPAVTKLTYIKFLIIATLPTFWSSTVIFRSDRNTAHYKLKKALDFYLWHWHVGGAFSEYPHPCYASLETGTHARIFVNTCITLLCVCP